MIGASLMNDNSDSSPRRFTARTVLLRPIKVSNFSLAEYQSLFPARQWMLARTAQTFSCDDSKKCFTRRSSKHRKSTIFRRLSIVQVLARWWCCHQGGLSRNQHFFHYPTGLQRISSARWQKKRINESSLKHNAHQVWKFEKLFFLIKLFLGKLRTLK